MKRRAWGRTAAAVLAALLILAALPPGGAAGDAQGDMQAGEERAVERAARAYLEAEVRRDFEVVWALLAPSSVYCETHDFRAYREEAEGSPVRIVRFDIRRVAAIRPNHDPARFPKVERFADVEVDLVLYFTDTETRMEVNHRFTFIREGGRWFKG